jgi:hypothetical protein
MTNWKEATTGQVLATLDAIEDAGCIYSLDHFPADVHSLVRQDLKRHFASAEDGVGCIYDRSGRSNPEAVTGVYGMDLAKRIADDVGLEVPSCSGRRRWLRKLVATYRHHALGEPLEID